MIIELFGPPGAGKAVFAHALAKSLRGQGYATKVVFSHKASRRSRSVDLGIFMFIYRVFSAIFSTAKLFFYTSDLIKYLSIASSMLKAIEPRKFIWRARVWQKIINLSNRWDQARQCREITIFDQGYVQAVASLSIFHGCVDNVAIARALKVTPTADFTLRVVLPRAAAEARLRERMMQAAPAERILDADFEASMRAFGVFQNINDILVATDRKTISVETLDDRSLSKSVELVSRKIAFKMARDQVTPMYRHQVAHSSQPLTVDNAYLDDGVDTITIQNSLNPPGGNDAVTLGKQEINRSLGYATVFALMIYVTGAGLTSLAQLLIARIVGSTSYGIYSYVLSTTSVLAYLATLGFNVSLLRFVSAYRAQGRLDLAHGIIRFAFQRSLAVASLFGLAGATYIFLSSSSHNRELEISQLLGMAAVPLVTTSALGAALIRAFGGGVSALLPERIVRDGLLLTLLSVAALSGSWTLNAPLVMQAVLTSSAVTVAFVFVLLARFQPPGLRHAEPADASKDWWSAVPPIMLMAGLDVFINRAGVMVLGWTGHIRDAGIFALGLNVALLVGLSLVAVSTMFSPTAATLYAKNDRRGLQELFSRAALLSSGAAIAMAIPLLLIVRPLLSWFGEDFGTGAPIARVLMLGYVFVALCGPQLNLLTMTGNEWAAAVTMILGAAFGVVGCAIGVEIYGPLGAAIGLALALVVWNVAMAIYIRKRLKITPGLIYAITSFNRRTVESTQRTWFLR
ncbi:lipopolysaccharide biosynthesis protein [Mesorhizobium sp. CA7]|uniref:lipopolysaccharide biosynthesis protein n=1 Tax=Mesorhizobium sp. CA7 TaxID=588501 RepID=UPI001CCB9DD0|nr:lipopolysaccharide biosynthesis protein [Mesorhizobium sp. CA7]MBZ9816220.1 polysaccharide biosynthesis C-terminal domain-containing protein [Mesorhizobium sp. CA7]